MRRSSSFPALVLAVFPSVCLTFAVLLAWGLAAAVLAQAVAVVLAGLWGWHHTSRMALTFGQYAMALTAAEVALRLTGLRPYPADGTLTAAQAGAVVLAATAWFLVRYATRAAAWRWRRHGHAPPRSAREVAGEAVTYAAMLLLSPLVVAAAAISPALVPLFLPPLYAVYRMARLAEDLADLARQDPLTGLANRATLAEVLAERMAGHAERSVPGGDHRLALLLLDLDRFKNVNDALGHEVGDRLLAEVGRRLLAVAGPYGEVARLGGDEFAVVAYPVSGAADARALAGQIAEALAEPVALEGLASWSGAAREAPLELEVSASIGVAVHPDHGKDVATLMRRADVAMYQAKQLATPVAVYASESDDHSPQRLELLADLRSALRSPGADGVEMHYQPQIAVATGEVVGVEALLRWRHPTLGPVDPDELIRAAEHTAVMRRLTLRVLEEVVAQVAAWADEGVRLRASINVSVRDLHTGEVAERLAGLMRLWGVPASQLQLEITEGALMADPRRVLATTAALERLGVAISLDDFGTGYSSLQHVRRLPLAEVKVDRSYVQGMVGDPEDAAVVRSIVELADGMGLRVVAEGVEDEATWRALVAAGCQVAQGWYCARAMAADELLPWLATYRQAGAAAGGGPFGGRTASRTGAVQVDAGRPGPVGHRAGW